MQYSWSFHLNPPLKDAANRSNLHGARSSDNPLQTNESVAYSYKRKAMSIITCGLDPHEDLLLFSPSAESLEGAEDTEDGRQKEDRQGDMDVEEEEQGEAERSGERDEGAEDGQEGEGEEEEEDSDYCP